MYIQHQRGHANASGKYHLDPRNVAAALGGEVTGRDTVSCPGPKHSARDRSLRVFLDPDAPRGFRVHSLANDNWQLCADFVASRLGLPTFQEAAGSPSRPSIDLARVAASVATEKAKQADAERERKRRKAAKIWQQAETIQRGDLADRYFRQRLGGHELTEEILGAGQVRFNANHTGNVPGSVGCIVCRMVEPSSGEFIGISRIFVDIDARKLCKKMLGGSGVVHLCGEPKFHFLAVTEGVENAIAALIKYDIAAYPITACMTADNLAKLPVFPDVRRLHIFADNDASGKGLEAGIKCGQRWLAAGREVQAWMPPVTGVDIADMMEKGE